MAARNDETVVEFRRVTYHPTNAPQPIVADLNFTVRRGETLVLLGESGCGKTTTLRLINRMLTPTSGDVVVSGKPTGEWDPIQLRRSTGYVIQEAGLFPHFTVERNVALVPRLEHWEDKRSLSRAHEMLSLVGLEPGILRRAIRMNCQAVSGNAWAWRAPWPLIRRFCCSTNRSARLIL